MRISDWSSDVCSSDLSHPDNLKQIARELGVAHIVEGSVQKVGNDVLISVQLVDSRTDHHVWAESYQRTLDNIFGVEGEVAGRIAAALQARLSAPEVSAVAQVPTTNPRAYDDYLRGLNFQRLAFKGRSDEHTSELQPLMRITYAGL